SLLRLPPLLYPAPEPEPVGVVDGNGSSNGHDMDGADGDSMLMGDMPRLSRANKMFVVVVRVGDRQMGLQVDSLVSETEIVIKPLSRFLGEVRGIAGVTILGDGQVAIICDVPSLVN